MNNPAIASTRPLRIFGIALVAVALLASRAAGGAEGPAQQTRAHVENLRAVAAPADAKTIAGFNRRMDEAWKFFNANKADALPVLREQLAAETRQAKPHGLVLLDLGYFLFLNGTDPDKELAKSALFALDTSSTVVRWNSKELFDFTHGVAELRDPRVLSFIDKAFLGNTLTVDIPQHALHLDETLVCVFLYGVYGEGAEEHLRPLLREPRLVRRVLEILIWLGSPAAVPEVKAAYGASRDYETFARVTAFMMKAGGPQGRAAMLELRPADLDAKSRDYLAKVKPSIVSASYESLRKQFREPGAAPKLSDAEVKTRLTAMNARYGKDETTSPTSILDATLPGELLIGELVKIRARTFHRLSDEALSDVVMTNALINTLRYRAR